MEATHSLTFTGPPSDLLARLGPVLAAQGRPPIDADCDGGAVRFAGETAEFMVRARAADALTAVWPSRQHAIRE